MADSEDNDEVLSETCGTDDVIDTSLVTDLPGVQSITSSAAPLGAEPDADECTTVVGGSDTAATTEEIRLSLNPGSSRLSSVTDGDFCNRATQSPSSRTSSPLRPPLVKRDNYPECFSDTSLEAGHVENEKENLNVSRLSRERQRLTLEQELSANLTSTEIPSRLSHLASGDESSDGDQSCHGIDCMPDYLKDLCESSSRPLVPRVMDAPAPMFSPVFLPENPPTSARQSSVKQLESFVASVECQSPSKPRSSSEKKGPTSIVQMPVAALSRKCKSSRMKTHSLNLPKMLKQPPESVCQYALPTQASDPNQPLDLSVKTRQKDMQPSETKYLSCSSDSAVSAVGTIGSSLADLEKKFGNTSAIFDRIGTKTWASPFCGALVSRLGVNLYNSKLHGAFSDSVSAFGMIPVPVQHFNTSLNSVQTVPAAKPDVPLLTKPELPEPAATDLEAVCHAAEPSFHWHQKQTADASSDQRKHTNFQCSCGAELETLYHLTMHLQQTGHAPNKLKNVGRQEYSKLVRGQDMWLNHGCEQTRQILRCMECDESFKSLPELTVHMIQTKHYANIVGADTLQRKVPSKNSESRSEPSSESSDANRVHCLVCLEPFDDAASLGNHILQAGHYKSTPERVEEGVITKKETEYQSPSSKPDDSLVDPASPQSDMEDSCSLETMPIKIERDRKRDHSSEGCIPDDCKKYEATKRSRTTRSSTSEDDVSKGRQEKELEERTEDSPGRFVEPAFEALRHSSSSVAGLKEKLEANQRSPGENDNSLPGSCDDNGYKPNCSQRSTRSDSERSCRGAPEEPMERSNSSAFHMENFFRPPSNSSSDGSAIRAMETFIKNSFGSTDTKHRSKVLHQMSSHLDSSSLVSSLISRFGTYVEHQKPGQNTAGRQEIRSSETPDNSSLYQNKYFPPVYIAPLSDGQTESDRVLIDSQYWPAGRRVKSESTEAMSQKGVERQSLDSEGPSRESESAGKVELERPASVEKQGKTKWVQRPDNDIPPDHFRRSEADSVIHDNFLFSIKSNKSADLKAAERTKGGVDIGDAENEERPSSTSNNLSRSSALESLQGLVYGKALNSEHPLDSLQKLIYGRAGGAGVVNSSVSGSGVGHVLHGPNGSHAAVIMKGADALHHPLPPGTLILVNPIVTVVPGASGSNPSLNITLPGCEPSPGAPAAGDDGAKRSEAGRRLQSPLDDRENSLRIYRCRGCRRKFSSKGSYRYHLSRCHVLTSSTSSEKCSSIKEPLKKSPYICLPRDATAKFNKYYKLASELGTEAK